MSNFFYWLFGCCLNGHTIKTRTIKVPQMLMVGFGKAKYIQRTYELKYCAVCDCLLSKASIVNRPKFDVEVIEEV